MKDILLGIVVVTMWSATPILKRVALDYMKYPDLIAQDAGNPVNTFVLLNSIGCTAVAACLAAPTSPKQFMDRLPAPGWSAVIGCVILTAASSVALTSLLSRHNPGAVIAMVNAGTSVLTYLVSTLWYGELTWNGVAGVLAIAGGIVLL